MCFLAYIPAGITPDRTALENAAHWNDDGHGWAIVAGTRIVMGKSMNAQEAIDGFLAARERYDGPALFHSRWATHGSVTLANTHPFVVNDNPRVWVAHNGVMPGDFQPETGDDRSDTRLFAEDWLGSVYEWAAAQDRKELGEDIGKNNKLVILSADPRYPTAIINEASGSWTDDQWWASNGDYRRAPLPKQGGSMWDDTMSCEVCFSDKFLDHAHGICWQCESCLDCGEDARKGCACYGVETPAYKSADTFAAAYGWNQDH